MVATELFPGRCGTRPPGLGERGLRGGGSRDSRAGDPRSGRGELRERGLKGRGQRGEMRRAAAPGPHLPGPCLRALGPRVGLSGGRHGARRAAAPLLPQPRGGTSVGVLVSRCPSRGSGCSAALPALTPGFSPQLVWPH